MYVQLYLYIDKNGVILSAVYTTKFTFLQKRPMVFPGINRLFGYLSQSLFTILYYII